LENAYKYTLPPSTGGKSRHSLDHAKLGYFDIEKQNITLPTTRRGGKKCI